MKAPRSLIFIKAIIPGSLNGVLQSMRLNIGLGLLGAFLGEFIASQAGLGYIILRASSLYDIPRAYAAAIGIGILALVFDRVAALVEDKSLRIVEIVSVPRIAWKKY
jgi:NitT/TauT family transport system permease protein